MANADHLERLQQGVDVWNAWRLPSVGPDLVEANLRGADLKGADLVMARLHWADLVEANLEAAALTRADLFEANLEGAILSRASLFEADLRGANFRRGNLSMASLEGADLRGADLRGANLKRAILVQANLIDACLDGADLTGAYLWETQRGGWSIKSVICRIAFWDRDAKEPTHYEEGEFERIFAEKPRIILRYADGISPIDLLALPLVVERLQAEYPGSALHIRSMQDDAGGASVTITVEDRENRTTEVFAAEIEKLRTDLLTIQDRLHNEEKLRLSFEAQCQVLVERVIPTLAAAPKQQVNIGQLTGPTTIERIAMSRDTYNIPGQAGAVGPGAQARNNTFQQIQAGTDLPKLAEELGRLHAAMKGEATGTREQDKEVVAVADAEEAALTGNGSAALQYLKRAGEWTLGIAEKIGVALAVEALKRTI